MYKFDHQCSNIIFLDIPNINVINKNLRKIDIIVTRSMDYSFSTVKSFTTFHKLKYNTV